ncbi:MAG TPA: Uma2 family endonuclease [Campylobacterales bacterium]|nr:Uma2 family endonuclease [Campylobacterales bacterium]
MSVADILDKYTYKDYTLWEGDWELIEGRPVSMAPAPMRIHQNIATELIFELKSSLHDDECPDCIVSFENDWKVDENTILRPDIIFTCGDEGKKYLTIAPKIIIEVLSPSTAKKDEQVKFKIYEDEKVLYYILVYPDELKAKVFKLENDKYTKIGDFTKERLDFEDLDCELSINFEMVFKKFIDK